ncbi:MAG: hypothetical protein ACOCQR_02040 [bacterium]
MLALKKVKEFLNDENKKEVFYREIAAIEREGVKDLIKFLKANGFHLKPASINHHSNVDEGLMIHSYVLFAVLLQIREEAGLDDPKNPLFVSLDTVRIVTLLHDVCKYENYTQTGEISDKQSSYLASLARKHASILAQNEIELEYDEKGKIVNVNPEFASALIGWLKENPYNNEAPSREGLWAYNKEQEYPFPHGPKSVSILQDFIKLTHEEKLAIAWHMGYHEGQGEINRARELYHLVELVHPIDELACWVENWLIK